MRVLLRDRLRPRTARRLGLAVPAVALALIAGTSGTQDAVANGDTRTLSIFHTHSKESLTVTFKRDGRYDRAALEQLNWLLRDWRVDEPTKMDPRLFDTVWEAYRQTGSGEAIHVVSAYRSPGTNAMLRRRSKAVAEYSQHMLGKAMDFYLPDVSIDQIRAVGMRMQRGGVGWYPRAGSPFVHLDVGSVRSWPRMTHDQLARLFPDGKTVHLPTDNHPLPRYEEARAEILSRGGTVLGVTQVAQADEDDGPSIKSFFAGLFGGGGASEAPDAAAPARARAKPVVAVASADPEDTTGTQRALAYTAPAASEALRGSLLRRDGRDAQSLLTAETPQAAGKDAGKDSGKDAGKDAGKESAAGILAAVAAPLPPRRPAEFAAVAAALTMPLPPPRPVQLAGLGGIGMANVSVANVSVVAAPEPEARPAPAPAPKATVLIPADAAPKAQLRALFDAVAATGGAAPASRAAPVHVALARARPEAAPDALVAEPAGAVATRFSRQSPGDELAAARFSGSALRPVPGQR
ncbi:DUF882 domain-containing protein [Methylobacterium planeticum]|uniref:Murein endopeptidase K n=1 Tax=Methylobacterium planeticum TaxID=2615211 RepID=A0A6N6ML41_9HYPH|nr:DUF882 domain-containing protein [Methylobacterium planeticum]KAB1070428.1 DUF882 domain-containing protein [Methylobacterium planeticum]